MAKTYTVQPGQSLLDVCLVCFGTAEAVFAVINLNIGFDINTRLAGGQVINIPDNYPFTPASRRVFGFLSSKPVKPATQPPGNARITEDGTQRITENSINRIV